MLRPYLIFILMLTLVAGCSKPVEQVEVKVSMGHIGTIPNFSGGFILWGKHLDSGKTFSIATPPGSVNLGEIQLDVGPWDIYAFGYDGGSPFDGPSYCDRISSNIQGESTEIILNVAQAKCDRADITNPSFVTSNTLQQVKFISCLSIAGASDGGNCDSGSKGNWQSYKVVVPSLAGVNFSNPSSKLESTCFDEVPGTNSITTTTIRLPVIPDILGPKHFIIKAYEDPSCNEGGVKKDFIIDANIDDHPEVALHQSIGFTEIFLENTNVYTGGGGAPTIAGVTPPGTSLYKLGDVLNFTVTFSENVNIGGSPRIPITLNTGGTVYADYVSGTGSPNIIFSYTVSAAQEDLDGITINSPIDLNGGTIQDTDPTPAILTFSPPATPAIHVDGIIPLVAITTSPDANLGNYTSYVLSGTCSDNTQNVSYDIDGGAISGNVVCTGGTWTTGPISIIAAADGPAVPITADHMDVAGNIATQASTTINKDTGIPTVTLDALTDINTINQGAYTVTGTCSENGRMVNVFVGGTNATPICTANVWTTGALDVSGEGDNAALSVTADHDDAAGNNATQASNTTNKDTVIPTVSIGATPTLNLANYTAYSINGTCSENGMTVNVFIGSVNVTPTCTANSWTTGPQNISGEGDGIVAISADHMDAVGNNATQATANPNKDTVAPAVTIDTPTDISLANYTAYVLTGTCTENGQTVNVFIGGLNFTPTCLANAWTTGAQNVSGEGDNPALSLTADHDDAAGNNATQASTTNIKDTIAPTLPSMDVANGFIFENGFTVNFSGSTDANFDNYYMTDDTSAPICGSNPGPSYGVTTGTHGDVTQVRLVACDAVGNMSTEADHSFIYIDPIIAPFAAAAPNWNDYLENPLNPGSSACSQTAQCEHGGELRAVHLNNVTSCTGLTMSDNLSVFNWICDDSITGYAVFLTAGFQIGKGLKDLITTSAWNPLDVTVSGAQVQGGSITNTASNSVWGNTVQAIPTTSADTPEVLNSAGTIYTNNTAGLLTDGYEIGADGITIISLGPGSLKASSNLVTLNCDMTNGGSASPDSYCVIWGKNFNNTWIETEIDGYDGSVNVHALIYLHTMKHNKIVNSHLYNADFGGVYLEYSEYNYVADNKIERIFEAATPTGYAIGVSFNSDSNKFFRNEINHSYIGFGMDGSTLNYVQNLKVFGAIENGVELLSLSDENTFFDIHVANTHNSEGVTPTPLGAGFYMYQSVDNIVVNLTTTSNTEGVYIVDSDANIFKNITTAENTNEGFLLGYNAAGSIGNTVINIASYENAYGLHIMDSHTNSVFHTALTNNSAQNLRLYQAPYVATNNFQGEFIVGAGGTNCFANVANQGIANGSCAATGPSSINSNIGPSLLPAFKGAISGSNTGYGALTFDFFNSIATAFESWGTNAGTGPCSGGTCHRLNFALVNSNGLIRDIIPSPGGNDDFTHNFNSAGTVTFLPEAREINIHDGLPLPPGSGNNNFLCESGEHCVSNFNLSSYQGNAGSIVPDGGNDISAGSVNPVSMYRYSVNGVPP